MDLNGAYASFEEGVKGSIRLGKLADLVFLDRDPLTADPHTIKDIKVIRTIAGAHSLSGVSLREIGVCSHRAHLYEERHRGVVVAGTFRADEGVGDVTLAGMCIRDIPFLGQRQSDVSAHCTSHCSTDTAMPPGARRLLRISGARLR